MRKTQEAQKKELRWLTFEDAVRSIISNYRQEFGLDHVDEKAGKILGKSGYEWNIEIIGYTKNGLKTVLFECRRKTTRNIEPGHTAEFAYRIDDTGSERGFFVTPLEKGLSAGAKMLADCNKIGHIQISKDANPREYLMFHLNQVFLGVHEKWTAKEQVILTIYDRDGNLIEEQTFNDPNQI